MKVLVSKVYRNQTLNFGKFFIEFKGEKAKVEDEQAAEILASGFPNIFLEGSEQAEEQAKVPDEQESREKEAALIQEIHRLTDRLADVELERDKLKADNEAWKKAYNEACFGRPGQPEEGKVEVDSEEYLGSEEEADEKKEEEEEEVEVVDPKEELRMAMNGLTVKQLKELAKGKDYNLTDEDIAPYGKKADLIEFLLAK